MLTQKFNFFSDQKKPYETEVITDPKTVSTISGEMCVDDGKYNSAELAILAREVIREYGLPKEFLVFLDQHKNDVFRTVSPINESIEMEYFSLRNSSNLAKFEVKIPTLDKWTAKDLGISEDPNQDRDFHYCGTAIDILYSASDFDPAGLLVFLPDFQVFGSYDRQHFNLVVFPQTTFAEIILNPAIFIAAQWGVPNNSFFQEASIYTLKPWEKWVRQEGKLL